MSTPNSNYDTSLSPVYNPHPPYAEHDLETSLLWTQKERIAELAENKLDRLFSRKTREPSLHYVLLQATLLIRISNGLESPLEASPKYNVICGDREAAETEKELVKSVCQEIGSEVIVMEDITY
jgi:hypothetical protein